METTGEFPAARRLDEVDRQLLHHLGTDGRMTNRELAERVHLSPSATLRRMLPGRTPARAGNVLEPAGVPEPATPATPPPVPEATASVA